jgi:hypothetical protein
MGSLVTSRAIPKDADVLVTINGTMDLGQLARAGRRLKGSAQTINLGADIFLADVTGRYLGRICHYRECHPRVACLAPSIADAANTSMTTFMSSRYRKNCLPRRQLISGQKLPAESRCRLM